MSQGYGGKSKRENPFSKKRRQHKNRSSRTLVDVRKEIYDHIERSPLLPWQLKRNNDAFKARLMRELAARGKLAS